MKKILILMFSLSILFASYSCGKKGGLNPTEKISFNFEIVGGGVLELSATNSKGESLYNYTISGNTEKIEIEKDTFLANTLVAKANDTKGYIFSEWYNVEDSLGDAVIIKEYMTETTIKAIFTENPYTSTSTSIDPETDPAVDYSPNKVDGWIWVSKPEHIKWISEQVNSGNSLSAKQYKLLNNINFNGLDHTSIGNDTKTFSGKIDGNGKSIKYAVIKANGNYVGFIGYMSDGEIKNLTIDSTVIIDVNAYKVAGIVGSTYRSKISYSTNKAEIKNSGFYTAGIVAEANASVLEYLANEGNILASGDNVSDAGGIVGVISSSSTGVSKISYSYNTGNIMLENSAGNNLYVGGLVGEVFLNSIDYATAPNKVIIEKCYNSGDVTLIGNVDNSQSFAGGIAGTGATDISHSYNIGNIKSTHYASGILGSDIYYPGIYDFSVSIVNCYSLTAPSPYTGNDKTKLGGIVGTMRMPSDKVHINKVYFVNTTGLNKNDGYSASSSANAGDSQNRTKTAGDLSILHNELGTSVWGTKNGRPVIKGLGEGVGIN